MSEHPDKKGIEAGSVSWEEGPVAKTLAKSPERREQFQTSSGAPMERLYTPLTGAGEPYMEQQGFPGLYPFTRGVQPTMYRGRFWTMRQYAGFGSAVETNERFRYLLEQGQTGLSVAFDLPTQMGYDPDHPMALGEVGKVGVSIASLDDMRQLFDRIPLDKVSTSMTINSTAAILLAMYVAVAEEQGVGSVGLRGTIQNDLLKEYVARGTYIFPPRPSLRIITDLFVHCKEHLPKFNTISISGYHIREAGSTAAQEVAHGIAYVQAAIDSGLEVDAFAGRLSFFFGCHNNFLEEIAKFRAARRMWARIMRERFGAKQDRSCSLRFHTQTCGATLTAQQPGTQSLHTNSRDEALALPSEEAVRIALRTQQVIAYESGVADVVDPLGGSYAIEAMTDQLEAEALGLIARIDELGGAVKAIEEGFAQRAIADASYEYQKSIESEERIIVGVNRFTSEETVQPNLLKVSEEVGRQSVERIRAYRSRRDEAQAQASLESVRSSARGTDNLFGPILQAVKAGCTTGEVSDALRDVFGSHQEN